MFTIKFTKLSDSVEMDIDNTLDSLGNKANEVKETIVIQGENVKGSWLVTDILVRLFL